MKQVDLMKCPYNLKHLIPKESFLNHLRKCQATNKSEFAICKFNPYHIIRKEILGKHYQQCDNALERSLQKQEQSFWADFKTGDEEFSINTWGDGVHEKSQELNFSGMFGENAAPSEQDPSFQASRRGNRTKGDQKQEKEKIRKKKVERKQEQLEMGDW